ncbi:preprotein translocase subunit SecG [Apilactobacillus xinyiensis]|uniref:Protein-export membrane protein SecG n=1 Tax=Apilactobacillus xinyiensis TaxID=2841032 RepID=A0ABT0HZE4_9LACO|nr:preprotein translocase subunit SecG [Apilactobacillus xinyiensis]MCK8623908.1 preprotein translocase subunit SecG [Apilactobacillus xinyiensis]MCL0311501.1 preprotein translocase subunit SecG [Apilactobacillus xinyiensis]MCL0318355.1 preprotein translocase subunit SecG [Apilactobacillus xinyiensis]MCL0330120.1 preprotein translocase subunit SecG [Apilactobacillus xinyiensis]
MYNFLMSIIWIDSVLIIISVLMQPAKTNDAMSSLTGGADDLFAHAKPRGFEAFMQKVTVVLGVIFFVTALALVWLSSH